MSTKQQGHPNVALAIAHWADLLGAENVVTAVDELRAAETATFETHQRVPAILRPANTAEVQACVRIANECATPLYPVSKGRNWGLGSAVPVQTGCVVLDLGRMNRIVEFNDELGYITVEPGVSFRQASDFVRQQNAKSYVTVIGGPPDASLIGNYLERGTGVGPAGDRAHQACGAEIVLGTGDIIHTGFAAVAGSKASRIHRDGVGPSLDDLFLQSNFGIITCLTIWLPKRPSCFQFVMCSFDAAERFEAAIGALRHLQEQHVVPPFSAQLYNNFKFASLQAQHPDPDKQLDIQRLLAGMNHRYRRSQWFGLMGLYSGSKDIGKAQRKAVLRALKSYCERITFVDDTKYRLLSRANRFARFLRRKEIVPANMLHNLFVEPIPLGYPSDFSIKSIYWRKRSPPPPSIDPHRDKCGVIWACHVVPFRGSDVREASEFTTSTIAKHRFEPSIGLVNSSTRYLRMLVAIMYDRAIPGQDKLASECHTELISGMNERGFTSFRLGVNSMKLRPQLEQSSATLLTKLKQMCDSNGILAPGRYEFVNDVNHGA